MTQASRPVQKSRLASVVVGIALCAVFLLATGMIFVVMRIPASQQAMTDRSDVTASTPIESSNTQSHGESAITVDDKLATAPDEKSASTPDNKSATTADAKPTTTADAKAATTADAKAATTADAKAATTSEDKSTRTPDDASGTTSDDKSAAKSNTTPAPKHVEKTTKATIKKSAIFAKNPAVALVFEVELPVDPKVKGVDIRLSKICPGSSQAVVVKRRR